MSRRRVGWLRFVVAGWLLATLVVSSSPDSRAQPGYPPPQDRYGPRRQPPAAQRYGGPATPTPQSPSVDDQPFSLNGGQVLAHINGEVVLAADVNWQVQERIKAAEQQRGQRVPPEQLGDVTRTLARQLVLGLVQTKVLYADFRRKMPAENLPLVEKQLAKPFNEERVPQLIEALGVKDRAELDMKLRSYGSSLKDLQRQFNEGMIARTWMLEQRLPKPKEITHDQLLAYYNDHLSNYEYPAKATYEELTSRFDRFDGDRNATWRAVCEMGNEVWRRVVANPGVRGPVFAEIARNHPNSHGFTAHAGGVHENITIGSLRCGAINDALAKLEVGQLSSVIESADGFHIVRVIRRTPAGRTSFEEAQADIRETLKQQQMQELQAAEMKKLLAGANVWTVFDGDLRGTRLAEALEGPVTR